MRLDLRVLVLGRGLLEEYLGALLRLITGTSAVLPGERKRMDIGIVLAHFT